MKFYETIFILDAAPDVIEADIQKVTDLITANKGEVVSVDRWGMRKLAYEIKRKSQGYYTCIFFTGDESIPGKLENQYKLNENCLRYLTVVSIHTPEEISARVEKAEKEASAAVVPRLSEPPEEITTAEKTSGKPENLPMETEEPTLDEEEIRPEDETEISL